MTAASDAVPFTRYGLGHFDAIDSSGRPQLENGEELASDYTDVKLYLGDDMDVGQGHLYISSKRIVWLGNKEPVKGCFAAFPSITMHAISQEPQPCIYAQLEAANSYSEEDHSEELYPEIRLFPAEPDQLQEMFETLCQCAALNPDQDDADDSEEGDFFYDEEEVLNGIGAENRAALLDRYDAMLDDAEQPDPQELTADDPDRFADPEEEEDLSDDLHSSA